MYCLAVSQLLKMKSILCLTILFVAAIGQVRADGKAIVAAARSQIGLPYSWGGGGWAGKSLGIESGAHTIGFDCSGLAQYSVYQGTHKKIARTATAQFGDKQCKHVPLADHQPGDLVFFHKASDPANFYHHVGIISGHFKMIQAPHTGDHVKESDISANHETGAQVARCW